MLVFEIVIFDCFCDREVNKIVKKISVEEIIIIKLCMKNKLKIFL